LYSCLPGLVFGFHGCDRSVAEQVIAGNDKLKASRNTYDWLGNGIYFWEGGLSRAIGYAESLKKNPLPRGTPIKDPFALGAIIDLGNCLNLVDSRCLEIVKEGYSKLCDTSSKAGTTLPRNTKPLLEEDDLLIRKLDCAVIETVHQFNKEQKNPEYDSVRGVFWEGKDLYENAGFKEKNHIQICVRNPNCIKGYFRPLLPDGGYVIPSSTMIPSGMSIGLKA
jgi:hypothetical protein